MENEREFKQHLETLNFKIQNSNQCEDGRKKYERDHFSEELIPIELKTNSNVIAVR